MTTRHLVVLILMLCAATPRSASTQSPVAPARVGDRIRVQRFDARHPRTGTLIARSPDSLTVEWQGGGRESMPLFEVERLDVSSGHRHYIKRGMLFGLVLGAGVGLIIRSSSGSDANGDAISRSAPYLAFDVKASNTIVPIAAGGGLALGALVGAMGTEQWRSTPVRQDGSRVGLMVPAGGAGLGIALNTNF